MLKVINLFGSPGAGKSTLRAGFNVEEVTEYAKDMVWEDRYNIFSDQLYLLGKQNRRILRLNNKVDYVLTDSPIILGLVYMVDTSYDETLSKLISEVFLSYENINIFINRSHDYQEVGRYQTKDEADVLSVKIKDILRERNIQFIEIDSDAVSPKGILSLIQMLLLHNQ